MSEYHITNEKFINPYNFVSINEDVERAAALYGALSGTIVCELEPLTPLFIPNTTNNNAFGNDYKEHSYDFFSYEDLRDVTNCRNHYAQPIIPGSSIRGAIRGAYEAATNSCMSTCDDENTLYRRTPVPRKSYGIIEKDPEKPGERILYKASKWKWPVTERKGHRTGEILRDGVYLRGENFRGKKNDAIMKYELDKNGDKIEITRFLEYGGKEETREWTDFVAVWRLYQKRQGAIKGVNQTENHSGYSGYLDAEAIPVYYTKLDNGSYYYIAPAAITKEVFSRTLKELLEKQGGHNPCEHSGKVCPACALFGMVGEEAVASRLKFRDGKPIEGDEKADWRDMYGAVRALPILSNPKVSATEFYMEDVDGSAYFNYDYSVNYYDYFDQNGKRASAPVRTLLENPRLRGRKLYWHRNTVIEDATSNFRNQRTEIRPVKAGAGKFRFEIAFDRLTQSELETLLWILTFGEDNETHAHKLGFGKPYGYGSVRVTKAEVSLVTLNDDLSLTAEISRRYAPKKPVATTALREYLELTDSSKASDDVKYPRGDKGGVNGPTTYDWFGINKEIRMGGFNPSFNRVLPKALDDAIALPGYKKGRGEIGNAGNREIRSAPAPEEQSDIQEKQSPVPKEPKGVTIGETEAAKIKAKQAAQNAVKTAYTGKQIKQWRDQPHNRTFREKIERFIRDYEADPEHYKELKGTYESIKSESKNA